MTINKLFKATNKEGLTYLYAYLGTDVEQRGCDYIHLYNISTQTNTNVEEEWFYQRKIKPLRNENGSLACFLLEYNAEVLTEGIEYFQVGNYYLHKGLLYLMDEKDISENGLSHFVDESGRGIYSPSGNLGSFVPFVASEGQEFALQEGKVLYHFCDLWEDFFITNQNVEPTEIKLVLNVKKGSKDLIDMEMHKAYNNWMNEECANSVLIDDELTQGELIQIPVAEYMLMWLDKLNLEYDEISI